MRKGLVFSFILLAVFIAMSAAGADVRPPARMVMGQAEQIASKADRKRPGASAISARTYRSPGKWRKVVIAADDAEALAQAKSGGAVEISDYQSFKLLMMEGAALETAYASGAADGRGEKDETWRLIVRDDFNVLFLRSG